MAPDVIRLSDAEVLGSILLAISAASVCGRLVAREVASLH